MPAAVFELTINGRHVHVSDTPPTTTLLDFLRRHGVTGPKRGCDEGDCGACTVVLVERDASGQPHYRAINSCLTLLPMVAGGEILTAEGLAADGALHPVQAALVRNHGSQCGYCTPGVVMSLLAAHHDHACPTPAQICDRLAGNLCRCTGYRSIRDAALELGGKPLGESAPPPPPFAPTPPAPLAVRHAQGDFFRPTSLAELFRLLAEFPAARLVAGATEIGVELNKHAARLPCLIATTAIPELTRITAEPTVWRIGGAATLAALEATVAPECPPLAQMLRLFASHPIRNQATLGGNLATASPIGDCAPVLLALDASLRLASATGERTLPLADFFTGYRRTALQPGEIIREILLPRVTAPPPAGTRRADFFKVSKRRELDISIVAAAFCVELDGAGVVRHARLAYGGVADRPRRATQAEAALLGRPLAAADNLIAQVLAAEFQPIDDVRGSANYRRGLVVSLWEKFAAGATSDAPGDFVPGPPWPATDPSRAMPHESGVAHVTGEALYADDLAQRRPMLDVWPVLSPHAHARIVRRDATRARQAPGVAAVLFAEDIPGCNNIGVMRADEPLLAADEVQYHGQLVALVVGESVSACRTAAALVAIDYEPRPAILSLAAAQAQDSWHTAPSTLRRGDCAAALAAAPCRFDGEFSLGGQEHFYLETQAAWAEPIEGGSVLVCSSTQHPTEIQKTVAAVLARPLHRVVTQSPRMGGGFGGKETQGAAFAALAALAAVRTGRPVRLQLDRDVDMLTTGKRHPFAAQFSVGHDPDGRLRAARIALVADGGWALDLSAPIVDRALLHLDNAYYLPAVEFSGRVAKTNVASNTAFRGFGGPQGMLVIEEILDRIARRLGLPPELVRERNLYHGEGETNTTPYGQEIGDHRLGACWRQVLTQADFTARRAALAAWNRSHPHVKRGLAVTPVKFGISFTWLPYNQAGALVLLYPDGTAQVNHGGTEMGQGLHTKILGVAMRELGLAADRIRIMVTSTDKVPNTPPTAASAGADLNGAAVAAACATLRARLAPVAARLLAPRESPDSRPPFDPPPATPELVALEARLQFVAGEVSDRRHPERRVPFADVCRRAWTERISLAATGYYRTPGLEWDPATGRGRRFHYFVNGAAVSEVELDGYTGRHCVRRVDVVEDVGNSLHPAVDRGQIEGGFVQGLGWLTCEDLRWDPAGRLTTHSASTYAIPACGDAPADFRVSLLAAGPQPNVIHGSKAVGEPPFMLAISVREALRDAVAAFGPPPAFPAEVPLPSPATAEALYFAVAARRQAR